MLRLVRRTGWLRFKAYRVSYVKEPAMNFSLSPDVERLIAEQVQSARYHSADGVVREGLELLRERKRVAQHSPSNGTVNFAAAFENIAKDVPDKDWDSVPADLSKNLDHYLYGGQKPS
jgi:Arc/MetJ-type ribon-helix-helix transcriptional regulator